MSQYYRALVRVILVAVLGLSFASAAPAAVSGREDVRLLRIGTGGVRGTYYPVGDLIARTITEDLQCTTPGECGMKGVVGVAQLSNGSVANVEALAADALEVALSQADVAYWAYSGTGVFSGRSPLPGLRTVASLYYESVHIVARGNSGIRTIADLRGKRVSLDESGSGTLVEARVILAAHGLTESDIRPVYLKPQFAAEKLQRNELDAFFIVIGYPSLSVEDLADENDIYLVPLDGEIADKIVAEYPFFTRDVIPADIYSGIAATPTLTVSAQLLVSEGMDDETVYQIARNLWGQRARTILDSGHPKGRKIKLQDALRSVGAPLHRGAQRYYGELGILRD